MGGPACVARHDSSCVSVYTNVCFTVRFSWDPAKGEANLRDRGFDFEFASLIFDGPTLEVEDRRQDYGERRMVAVGWADGIFLSVVFTDRSTVGRPDRRIISARRSNRRERQIYGEATDRE
jgi:uncharacterized DUF497 family protein